MAIQLAQKNTAKAKLQQLRQALEGATEAQRLGTLCVAVSTDSQPRSGPHWMMPLSAAKINYIMQTNALKTTIDAY
jgi:hypothetical protein